MKECPREEVDEGQDFEEAKASDFTIFCFSDVI